MLAMNLEMRKTYCEIKVNGKHLEGRLLSIVNDGFVNKEECLFLKSCFEIETNVTINDFPDKTGFECFINSINIDDYVENDFLEQGILFAQEVFSTFKIIDSENTLNCIMSMDELGLKIKFHLLRIDEEWLSDDLEAFEEAILVVDSEEPDWVLCSKE